jgi:hypothetical protein
MWRLAMSEWMRRLSRWQEQQPNPKRSVILTWLMVAAIAGVLSVGPMWKQVRTWSWTETTARIVHSEVGQYSYWRRYSLRSRERYYPNITYEFATTSGQNYQATGYRLIEESFSDRLDAERVIQDQFPVGAIVPVLYNPINPREALLDWRSGQAIIYLGVVVFVLAGTMVLVRLWR